MEISDGTFTIEARVIGQRNLLEPSWQIVLPATFLEERSMGDRLPFLLRNLIAYIVHSEVQAFRQRQEGRRLLHMLGPQEILDAAAKGKIVMGGASDIFPTRSEQGIDEQVAIVTALQAFEDGLYFVFLNGVLQQSLENEIVLLPRSTVTFIRLVALVGG